AEFSRDNFLTDCIGFLYSFDTNTGVCPSLHCAYSIGIASVWLKAKDVSKLWKAAIVIIAILICISTMFVKQHSALDFFAALPICLLAEILVFKVFYKKA
ncbi:MAG: phosphatase PAP2 family protein, partial [Clostridia bacterium]|nr:phosphatase PAP2 family protein [Clostridia bacterium]